MVPGFFHESAPVPRCIALLSATDAENISASPFRCSSMHADSLCLPDHHWVLYGLQSVSDPGSRKHCYFLCDPDRYFRSLRLFFSELEHSCIYRYHVCFEFFI